MKRIYFVAFDASHAQGIISGRREATVCGPLSRYVDEVEKNIQERVEKESGRSLNGPPRISDFKWVGVVALGREWRWN